MCVHVNAGCNGDKKIGCVGRGFLQESKAASEIIAVSVGPKAAGDTIRTALAMGADRGIHVLTEEAVRTDQGLEPLAVAGLLKKVI